MDGHSIKTPPTGQAAPSGPVLDARLLKPLALEYKQGCLNKAVSGGIEPFVRHWAPHWASRFAGYAALPMLARRAIVAEALEALQAAPSFQSAPTDPSPGPAAFEVPHRPTEAVPHCSDPVTCLPSLGPKRAAALRALGIETVGDLLRYTPRSWQDRGHMLPIGQALEGTTATIQARVLSSVNFRVRGGLTITEVALHDASGTLSAIYFNQPFQQRRFLAGSLVVLSGKIQRKGRRLQMLNPEAEVLPEGGEEALVHTGRIVPLYALNKELSQRVFRSAVWRSLPALNGFEDPLPLELRNKRGLSPLGGALGTLHFPPDLESIEGARLRLAFHELFLLSLALRLKKRREQSVRAPALSGGGLPQRLLDGLPFELTPAQRRVWKELGADLARARPMRRLLQGDVGSGKTVLAALCLAAAVGDGWQGALMAPTEILAEQHLKSLRRMFEPLGVEVLSLTQAQKGRGRREVLSHLAAGLPLIAVGTQALIQDGVSFGHLGLVVVDEQHRFGVRQRLDLSKKAREDTERLETHSLVMTATPIPRTLAMTVYGDLDVSVLDGLPPGRSPVRTVLVAPKKLDEVWERVRAQIAEGRQAYVVVPLVDESDKTQWKAATTRVEELRRDVFPATDVRLLHGRLKPEEKEAVMEAFSSGRSPVLCATTVVEVGVDVPNASVMVIEDADRFGLAQLHQLRGRVGRGAAQSWCFLVGAPKTEEGKRRLDAMVATTDGFVIAEEDLRLRGAGEVLGTRQSGLPEMRHADLGRDQGLVLDTRQAAEALLGRDPDLAKPEHAALNAAVKAGFGAKLELGTVG